MYIKEKMMRKHGKLSNVRFFALAIIASAMLSATAETTFYSAAASTTATTVSSIAKGILWCSDASRKNVLDPQPVPAAGDGTNYVFVSNKKLGSGDTFTAKAFFGSDGTTPAGSGTSSSSLRTNGSVTFDFADLTLVKGSYSCNSGGITKFLGKMTVATTEFEFNGGGIERNKGCRGVTIGSTLIGGESANLKFTTTVAKDHVKSLAESGGCLYTAFAITGDASAYKGKYTVKGYGETAQSANGEFWSQLRLESASAFGDPVVTNADAVTLGNFCYIAIGPEVVQSASRGITINATTDATDAGVTAAAGETWTLTAPVVCKKGIFAKRDSGTVRLNGYVSATNVAVRAGTLILGSNYQPPETQTITVASGATLVFERSVDSLPGVKIEREEGAAFTCPLNIPFDGTNTTPAVFADGYKFAEGVTFPVTLSQEFTFPILETNRLAVAVLTNGTVDVSLFNDCTGKTRDLPLTWFESETDPSTGVQTIYLMARPVLKSECTNARIGHVSYTSGGKVNYTWSDHLVDHAGADYYSSGSLRTLDGSNHQSLTFGGESLTLDGATVFDYVGVFRANDMRLFGNVTFVLLAASMGDGTLTGGVREREIAGSVNLSDGTFCEVYRNNTTNCVTWSATTTGSGTLKIYNNCKLTMPLKLYDVSPDFTGVLQLSSNGYWPNAPRLIEVSVTNALAFGGSPKTFTANAVYLGRGDATTNAIVVRAENDIAVTNQLRGWTITYATLRADKDVTFAFTSPLVVSGELRKDGEGTLALGTCATGAGKTFRVWEGYVQPLIANCCTNQNLIVTDGAGVRVTAEAANDGVATYGLRPLSILPEDSNAKIVAKVDLPKGFSGYGATVAVCTVAETQADLSGNFVVKPPRGYSGTIVKTALSGDDAGFVTYSAVVEKKGFAVIVR